MKKQILKVLGIDRLASVAWIVAVVFFAFTVIGCDEANMMKPVVQEPAEEPAMMGDVKEPVEEQTEPVTEPETPKETTEPEDTMPPTVMTEWYRDVALTEMITTDSSILPGDTVYVKVLFSEPVRLRAADDETARPALFVVAGNAKWTRFRVLAPDSEDIVHGSCKPLTDTADTFVCVYTAPENAMGTLDLRVGTGTRDLAGNWLPEMVVQESPVMITEPEPEGPMINEPTEEPEEPTDPAEGEQFAELAEEFRQQYESYGFSEEVVERLVNYHIGKKKVFDRYVSREISGDEFGEILDQLYAEAFGISYEYAGTLKNIYVEERPEEEHLHRGYDLESVGIAYLIVSEANPGAENFEELFRQAARDGTISIAGSNR